METKKYQFWFCTGSQDLYGEECLAHVATHSKEMVDVMNKSGVLPYEIVWKPTLITSELIRKTFNEANADKNCAGVITWMHTFSPAKSWILGLQELRKPLLHLHTQYNLEIPYDEIDMDFMNENQAAHGDREYGHIFTRWKRAQGDYGILERRVHTEENRFLDEHSNRYCGEQKYPCYAYRR